MKTHRRPPTKCVCGRVTHSHVLKSAVRLRKLAQLAWPDLGPASAKYAKSAQPQRVGGERGRSKGYPS